MKTLKEVQAAEARAEVEREANRAAWKRAVLEIVDAAAGVGADTALRAARARIKENAHEFLPSGILCDCGTQLVHHKASALSGTVVFHECVACGLSVGLDAFPGSKNGRDW